MLFNVVYQFSLSLNILQIFVYNWIWSFLFVIRNKIYSVGEREVHRISSLSNGPSRARIGISHLSVPLAWNSDEHFGTRGGMCVFCHLSRVLFFGVIK